MIKFNVKTTLYSASGKDTKQEKMSCTLPTATLVDGLTQSAKTWKVFDLLKNDLPSDAEGTLVLFVTQANSITSVNQLLSRAQHDAALSAKFPLMCRATPFSELFAKEWDKEESNHNAIVVDFWNTKNTCAMIQTVKTYKKKIQRIIICIDEADQGHKKGLKTRLDFVRKIEKRSRIASAFAQEKELHLIFITATVANLSKNIYALSEEHSVTYRRSPVIQRLIHDKCMQHCFVMPGPQYVGPSWYMNQDARMWKRLHIEPKNTHQNKDEYNAYYNDCINIQLDRLSQSQKRLTLIVASTNTCDQRRLCEKMFMLDYNMIVELNSLNNKNYTVFYRSEGAIMKKWTIPFNELERLADTGRLAKVKNDKRRFVDTGIESSLDLTLSYILQAALFMGTSHEDEIKANVVEKEWLRLYALMNAMTYSVKNTRPLDFPTETPRVAMIAGHLAGRGVTIQNPFIHFACTSFCFAGKRDVVQRGAQNSQKFGRACGMLSEIFVNKKQTPVLIATPDVVLDAHANEIALRQVSEEKEVCLKDLISRADWMRAMSISKQKLQTDIGKIDNGKIDGVDIAKFKAWLREENCELIIAKMVRFLYTCDKPLTFYEFKTGIGYKGSDDQFQSNLSNGCGVATSNGKLWIHKNKVITKNPNIVKIL